MKPAAALLWTATAIAAGCGTRSGPNIDAAVLASGDAACQHTCTPDPLPAIVNCGAAEAPYEFYDAFPIGLFDDANAARIYSYTDESNLIASFRDKDGARKTWEPPTVPMDRCASRTAGENRVLRIQGGPFLAWGGGIGQSMKDFAISDCTGSTEPACLGRDPAIPTVDPTNGNAIHSTLNLSDWEGVSFWGRRGPDSQGGIRVLVGDRYTDDDVSFLMLGADPTKPRYCERIRECACPDHMACLTAATVPGECVNSGTMNLTNPVTNMPVANTYCGLPHPKVSGDVAPGASVQCNSCDRNRCNEEWPAYPGRPDPAFLDRPCLPFTYRNGVSSSFCFNPDLGERPAEPDQQCGDHWTRPVALSHEWQFYAVPFNSMIQQGWAKHSAKMDLTNVSVVRFTWDGGWADFYIDDVRFYRHKK